MMKQDRSKNEINFDDISLALANPLVFDYLDRFIIYLLKENYTFKYRYYTRPGKTERDEYSGKVYIPDKGRYPSTDFLCSKRFGTSRMSALVIIEHLANNRPIVVYDTKWTGERAVNQKETDLAQTKANDINEEFRYWISKNDSIKKELFKAFTEKYRYLDKPIYDGSRLMFPGMAENFTLRPYQKDAVKGILSLDRTLDAGNTLLTHTVGSGKTAIMIAAAEKIREENPNSKIIFAVPNNILASWGVAYKEIYPNAKLLVVDPIKDFNPANRDITLKLIRDNYNVVIMAHSSFSMIPLSKQFYINDIKVRTAKINNEQAHILSQGKTPSQKLIKERKKLSDLFVRYASSKENDGICFDQLGITALFVDESQHFKNLSIASSLHVKGFSGAGSKKSEDLLYKVRCVQKNNGRVIFATATPITNSLAEVYTVQRFLQPELLLETGNEAFDQWVANFGEVVENFEPDVTTSRYVKTRRLGKFNNLKLLTNQFAQIAIHHDFSSDADLPKFDGYEDIVIPKSRALGEYLMYLCERATAVKAGNVPRTDDNMLLITTDGRKATLDIRLVDKAGMFNINSKVYRCTEKVAEIYFATSKQKLTQVIFCDISTPKEGFNIYDELKRLLINEGLNEKDIAFIHDYKTAAQKRKLFDAVNNGDIRIVLGSTSKLGTGVNMQERLYAAHHLDCPWRSSDLVQREGRIIRSGNTNKKIRIFRYVTEGSFDAYIWQLVESKARFIAEFTSGQNNINTASDLDDIVLSAAEIKALAVGKPEIKRRVEKQNELNRLLRLKSKECEEMFVLKDNLLDMKDSYDMLITEVDELEDDARLVDNNPKSKPSSERTKFRKNLYLAATAFTDKPNTAFLEYRGFSLTVMFDAQNDEPYLMVANKKEYKVNLKEVTEKGILTRVDNVIDDIPNRFEQTKTRIAAIASEIAQTEQALQEYNPNKYDKQIEELRKLIQHLDSVILDSQD